MDYTLFIYKINQNICFINKSFMKNDIFLMESFKYTQEPKNMI